MYENLIIKLEEAKKEEDKIKVKIDFIVHQIKNVFNCKNLKWTPYKKYIYYSTSTCGLFTCEKNIKDLNKLENYSCFGLNLSTHKNLKIILKNGKEHNLTFGIPKHWINESFEEELIQGKKAYDSKIEEKKMLEKIRAQKRKDKLKHLAVKAAKNLAKKTALLSTIKNKLTKTEIKLLLQG